jgi:uncharacterized protein (TIGR03435 family)
MLKRFITYAFLLGVAITVSAQQPPTVEVASIKPAAAAQRPPLANVLWLPGDRLSATGLTLAELIHSAYVGDGIQMMSQIVGGLPWNRTERFDIVGKLAHIATGNAEDANRQRRDALKMLLADRFALKVHLEQQEMPVFDLVQIAKDGRLGPKIAVSTCGVQGNRPCQFSRLVKMDPSLGMTMAFEGMTMAQLAAALVSFPAIGRPIRDRTGLSGAFDLELTMPVSQSAAGDAEEAIFTSLQEQLGLRLEGRRDRADVLVIDNAKQPTSD